MNCNECGRPLKFIAEKSSHRALSGMDDLRLACVDCDDIPNHALHVAIASEDLEKIRSEWLTDVVLTADGQAKLHAKEGRERAMFVLGYVLAATSLGDEAQHRLLATWANSSARGWRSALPGRSTHD